MPWNVKGEYEGQMYCFGTRAHRCNDSVGGVPNSIVLCGARRSGRTTISLREGLTKYLSWADLYQAIESLSPIQHIYQHKTHISNLFPLATGWSHLAPLAAVLADAALAAAVPAPLAASVWKPVLPLLIQLYAYSTINSCTACSIKSNVCILN
eukprot:SAG31_NODE_9764_length_1230_cov_2.448276_1_plen_153_part_00